MGAIHIGDEGLSYKAILRDYVTNTSGHFAVTTALVAIPLLMGVSVALDSNRMESERTRLKSALDSAAKSVFGTTSTLNTTLALRSLSQEMTELSY